MTTLTPIQKLEKNPFFYSINELIKALEEKLSELKVRQGDEVKSAIESIEKLKKDLNEPRNALKNALLTKTYNADSLKSFLEQCARILNKLDKESKLLPTLAISTFKLRVLPDIKQLDKYNSDLLLSLKFEAFISEISRMQQSMTDSHKSLAAQLLLENLIKYKEQFTQLYKEQFTQLYKGKNFQTDQSTNYLIYQIHYWQLNRFKSNCQTCIQNALNSQLSELPQWRKVLNEFLKGITAVLTLGIAPGISYLAGNGMFGYLSPGETKEAKQLKHFEKSLEDAIEILPTNEESPLLMYFNGLS